MKQFRDLSDDDYRKVRYIDIHLNGRPQRTIWSHAATPGVTPAGAPPTDIQKLHVACDTEADVAAVISKARTHWGEDLVAVH